MQVKRFDPTIGAQPRIQTGAQEQLSASLADRLKGFADRENKLADMQAQQEGQRAGEAAAAGRVGGVEIPDDMTIRDQAFAKGARLAHGAAIQTDIRGTVADLELNNANDIGAFNEQLEAYQSGLMQEIDETLQPMAVQELGDYALRSRVRIEKTIFDTAQAGQVADINTAADGLRDDAMSSAYLGDNAHFQTKREQLFELWDEGVANNLLDNNKVQEAKRTLEDEALLRTVTGTFDRTIQEEGLDQAEKSYQAFKSKKHKGEDPALIEKIDNKMKASLNEERARVRSEITRGKAEISAREKALDRTVKNASNSLDKGYQVEGLPELIEVSRGTKHEETLKLIQVHQDAVNQFVNLSDSEKGVYKNAVAAMDAQLKEAKSKKLNGEQVRLVERLEKTLNYTRSELNAGRGMDLGLSQGIITGIPPIDSPEGLRARQEAANTLSEHYGRPISAMTDAETDDLKLSIDDSTTKDKILKMSELVDTLGADSMPIFEQLSKKGSGTFAMAGSMVVDGKPQAGMAMLKGIDMVAAYPKIIPTDFNASFNQYIGSAYNHRPGQIEVLREAAKNLYAYESAINGDTSGEAMDSSRLDKLMNTVTGGMIELQHQGAGGWGFDPDYMVEAPADGVDGDAFIDWMENLTKDDVEAMGATGVSAELTQAINDQTVKLMSIGDGKYNLEFKGGRINNIDGSPFILAWPTE